MTDAALATPEQLKSYHGIAARLDRFPNGRHVWFMMWIIGGVCFCDCIDTNIGGPIIAQLLATGWSDATQNAMFVSITAVGLLFGGLMAGAISDAIGRKKGLAVNTTIFSAAAAVAAFAPDMNFLLVCRFFMGLGLGAAYPAGYSTLTEFTPPHQRGKYQAWMGLISNSGTPFATIMCLIILPVVGWRAVFAAAAIVGFIVLFILLAKMDESPRWLASRGENEKAAAQVTKYEQFSERKGNALPPVTAKEIEEREAVEEVVQLPYSFLFKRKMIKRTIVACAVCFANFLVVYTVVTWTPTIFVMRGFDITMSTAMTVVITLGIPVGVFLLGLTVDHIDRKKILCFGITGSAILGYLWTLIPADQTILIMAVGFVLCAITYWWSLVCSSVYLSEPFPTQVRIRGAGFGNAVGRIVMIVSPFWISALLNSDAGPTGVYILTAILAIICVIIIGTLGVETRGRTLEDITEGLIDEEDIAKYEAKSKA